MKVKVTVEMFETSKGCTDCSVSGGGILCGVSDDITSHFTCGDGVTALRVVTTEGVAEPSDQELKAKQYKEMQIKNACAYSNYVWPKQLSSGVMFHNGVKITVEEFNHWVNIIKNK
jgi:hypothetical protein